MSELLQQYEAVTGPEVIEQLRQLAQPLAGARVVHVNSTRAGGGVAEILHKLVPLMQELGIDVSWEVIQGDAPFYQCTKGFHNALQGTPVHIGEHLLREYERTNAENAERLRPALEDADVVFIHDPQPAPLLGLFPDRKGKWIWRCHIDMSHPYRQVWRYLRPHVLDYDASIFSMAAFSQPLPHVQYLIPPSIDPLSEKNMDLHADEVAEVCERFELDAGRPIVLQVSRFDRFKDPVGVIEAYRLAKRFSPGLQLVLAGGGASDDPEGEAVLQEARDAAADDADIRILLLPSDAHRTINALQRAADIVMQKSLREGFGLTVTEALWKGKPVVGGDAGGIVLQVVNHYTGFLVSTPEGAALRIQYLLQHEHSRRRMGDNAREFVRQNYLLTRQLREYLTVILAVRHNYQARIDLT